MFTLIKKLLARQAPAKQTRNPEVNPVKILHIDSSILGPYSVSRALSADIVKRQVAAHPNATITYRDLALHNVGRESSANRIGAENTGIDMQDLHGIDLWVAGLLCGRLAREQLFDESEHGEILSHGADAAEKPLYSDAIYRRCR